jgi:hypothetical protein
LSRGDSVAELRVVAPLPFTTPSLRSVRLRGAVPGGVIAVRVLSVRSVFTTENSAGEVRALSPAPETSVTTEAISEASADEVVVEEICAWSVFSSEVSDVAVVEDVEVELEVVVVPVLVEPVVEVELVVVLELGKVNVREMVMPAGTCVIVPVVRTIGWTEMVEPGSPAGRVAAELTRPLTLEGLPVTFEVEVAGVLLMTVTVTGAAARTSA